MKRRCAILCCLYSFQAFAATEAPLLSPLPEQSHIAFTATQNDAPVTGEFSRFTLTIRFDEHNLEGSLVTADIDLASVQTGYAEIADNLRGDDWFNVTQFPKARFESTHFTHKGDNHYEVVGTLSLHGHQLPVTLPFTLTKTPAGVLHVEGETTIKRSDFAIGQGEWATSSVIGDEVKITIIAAARAATQP